MKYLLLTALLSVTTQAFANDTLDAAFKAALANSEQDHQKQQVAFDVAPEQVEKATFKRVVKPHVVDVPASVSIDMPAAPEKEEKKTVVAPSSEDLAAMEQELSDIQ